MTSFRTDGQHIPTDPININNQPKQDPPPQDPSKPEPLQQSVNSGHVYQPKAKTPGESPTSHTNEAAKTVFEDAKETTSSTSLRGKLSSRANSLKNPMLERADSLKTPLLERAGSLKKGAGALKNQLTQISSIMITSYPSSAPDSPPTPPPISSLPKIPLIPSDPPPPIPDDHAHTDTPPLPSLPPPPIPSAAPPPIPSDAPPPIPSDAPPPVPADQTHTDAPPPPPPPSSLPTTPPISNTHPNRPGPRPSRPVPRQFPAIPSSAPTPPPVSSLPATPPLTSPLPPSPNRPLPATPKFTPIEHEMRAIVGEERNFHSELNNLIDIAQHLEANSHVFGDNADTVKDELKTIINNFAEMRDASNKLNTAFAHARTPYAQMDTYSTPGYADYASTLSKHATEGDHLRTLLHEFKAKLSQHPKEQAAYKAIESEYAANNGNIQPEKHMLGIHTRLIRHRLHLDEFQKILQKREDKVQAQIDSAAERRNMRRAAGVKPNPGSPRMVRTPSVISQPELAKLAVDSAQETTRIRLERQNEVGRLIHMNQQIEASEKLLEFMMERMQKKQDKFPTLNNSLNDFNERLNALKKAMPEIQEFIKGENDKPLSPKVRETIEGYQAFLTEQSRNKSTLQGINEGKTLGLFFHFERNFLRKKSLLGLTRSSYTEYTKLKADYEKATNLIL